MKPKNDHSKKKRMAAAIVAILIALSMVISMVIPFVYGAELGIKLSGNLGFDGKYRVYHATPLTVRVENTSLDAFQGEVLFKVSSASDDGSSYTSGRDTVYSKNVSLAPGEAAEINMEVKIQSVRRSFELELVDTKGKRVAATDLSVSSAQPAYTFAGVLSDNPDSLSYLRGLQFKTGESAIGERLVNVTADIFNSDAIAKNFDMLIINDFNTAALSDTQRNVLADWVAAGGVLAVGTGANYQKVMPGLEGLANITSAQTRQVTAQSLMDGGLLGADRGSLYVTHIEASGGKIQLDSEGTALSTLVEYGIGYVVLHGFDLAASPFPVMASTTDDLLITMYSNYIVPRGEEARYFNDNFTMSATNLPLLSDSTVNTSFYIILVYGVLLGPVLYLILKKKDARERVLLIIPIVSLAVTMVILVMGLSNPYKKPIANIITRTMLTPGQAVAPVKSSVGVFTPDSGDIVLGFRENFSPTPYFDNYYYYNSTPKNYFKLSYDNPASITYYSKPSWSSETYMANDGYYSFGDGLNAEFFMQDSTVAGKLVNNTGYTLSDIVLRFNGTLYRMTDPLPSGETMDVDLSLQDLQWMGITRVYELFTADLSNNNATRREFRDGYFKQNIMSQGMDLLGGMRQGYSGSSGNRYYDYGMGTGYSSVSYIDILALNYDPVVDHGLTIGGKNPTELHTNLFMMTAPVLYNGDETIELPFGILRPYYIRSNYGYSLDEASRTIHVGDDTAELGFYYQIPEGINPIELEFNVPQHLGASIYNYEEERFEEIKSGVYTENLKDYIGEGANIDIIYTEGPYYDVAIPEIRIKGVFE